jgi:VanZ family protein
MKKYLYFLPALLFYSLITFVSSQSLSFSMPVQLTDKVPHILEYTVMGAFLALGFFHVVPTPARLSIIVLTFFSGTLLGVLDEFHQKFVAGRVSDPKDAAADAIGVALGIAVYWYWQRKKDRRQAA